MFKKNAYFFIFFILFFLSMKGEGMGVETYTFYSYRSPFIIELKVEKEVYKVGEWPKGEVTIINQRAVTVPGVFDIKFYIKGGLFYKTYSSIPQIFSGPNHYSFKDFGIGDVNQDLNASGEWRIEVTHQNTDSTGSVTFKVVKE